ncbi:MAG TPA: DUF3570 domain-containing protein [Polyangia bacterium]
MAVIGFAQTARAEDSVDFSTSYFVEPAHKQALHVIHPQLDINVDVHPAISLKVGYDVDIVTGATPRIYGASMDAISSATRFTDYRHAVHGGAEVRVGPTTLDAGYTYSFENDYRSHAIDASAKVDLWGKNTSFKLGYSHNFDSVCDADNRGAAPLARRALSTSNGCFEQKSMGIVSEPLAIDSYFVAWTQVLSPILLSDLSVSFEALDGFQSNPYRQVALFSDTVSAQESEPTLRQRVAVQARLRIAVKKAHGAVGLDGRFYWDTWNIKSGTAEVSWEQYLGPKFLFRVRGRYYQQTRALFYRDAGEALSYEAVGPVGQYFTGDRELSPFRDWLAGIKIAYLKSADEHGKVARVFEDVDLHVKLDILKYEALTPLPPNEARSAEALSAALIQAGVSMRW